MTLDSSNLCPTGNLGLAKRRSGPSASRISLKRKWSNWKRSKISCGQKALLLTQISWEKDWLMTSILRRRKQINIQKRYCRLTSSTRSSLSDLSIFNIFDTALKLTIVNLNVSNKYNRNNYSISPWFKIWISQEFLQFLISLIQSFISPAADLGNLI